MPSPTETSVKESDRTIVPLPSVESIRHDYYEIQYERIPFGVDRRVRETLRPAKRRS